MEMTLYVKTYLRLILNFYNRVYNKINYKNVYNSNLFITVMK